jgi:VirE N-terminal domain
MPDIPLSDAQLSLFENSFNSTPIATMSLEQIIHRIQSGYYRSKVETVRQILAREGKPAYDKAKTYLPAVTFSGTFHPKRGNAYLQRHSGIIHADMDHPPNVAATKKALSSNPRVVYFFISPSMVGLKAGDTWADRRESHRLQACLADRC